jgi:hypothetical protein
LWRREITDSWTTIDHKLASSLAADQTIRGECFFVSLSRIASAVSCEAHVVIIFFWMLTTEFLNASEQPVEHQL